MLRKIGSIILLLSLVVCAAELNFAASVNRTEIGLGEPLLLTVSVEGENIGQVPSPELPDLPQFDIGGTSTSQSTNIQMVGGKVIRREFINFIYTLYPKGIGEAVIGSCKLEFQGETYQTKPIEVNVVQGTVTSGQPLPGSAPSPAEPRVAGDDNLKLFATASPRTVYQGELVVVEYSLYTRLRLADINLAEAPSFSGFWVKPIFDAQRIEFQRKVIEGKVYDVSLLRKSALFPMTTGRLRIAPMKLDVAVVQSPRDLFDLFGTTKTVNLASDVLYVDVVPLPVDGRPEEFTGGVGKFSIDASLDRTSSEAAEPINLTMVISGAGNVELIEKPRLPVIPGVKVLEPEVRSNTNFSQGSIRGYKEFNFPLIPQTDGEHVVPSIEMAYFDPSDKKYHTITTGQLRFTATGTASAIEIAQTGGLKKIGTDIAYIKPDVARLRNQSVSAGTWIVFPYLISLGLILLSFVYRRHQSRLLTDRAYARKLRSSKRVRQGLKEAQQHLMVGDDEAFHAILSKVVLGYIGDRYNLDTGRMTNDDVMAELEQRDVDTMIVRKLNELLNQCDMRFSRGMKFEDPQTLFQMVRELINKL
jgi:hypothetical protein